MNLWHIALPALATGAGVSAWGAIHPAAQLFGPTIRHTGRRTALALTFDDGPNPAVTPGLLGLLDRYQARATFFLIGRHVRACPELAKEIAAHGHTLGNHTDTHPNLLWLSSRQIVQEFRSCQESIAQATGQSPAWMRPPYGFRGPQLQPAVRTFGFHGVAMWSAMAYDWKPRPPQRIIERLRRVRGGQIILLHDGDHRVLAGDRRHCVAALEFWLPRWQDAGLEFVTLDSIGPLERGSGPATRSREAT